MFGQRGEEGACGVGFGGRGMELYFVLKVIDIIGSLQEDVFGVLRGKKFFFCWGGQNGMEVGRGGTRLGRVLGYSGYIRTGRVDRGGQRLVLVMVLMKGQKRGKFQSLVEYSGGWSYFVGMEVFEGQVEWGVLQGVRCIEVSQGITGS